MTLAPHIFREYDIRGVADHELTDALTTALGATFAMILRRTDRLREPLLVGGKT